MSKGGRLRSKEVRKAEKKKRKLANMVKLGPKTKDGDSKARKKLKGESVARPRVVRAKAKRPSKNKYLSQGVR